MQKVRYVKEVNCLVINAWVFHNTYNDGRFICSRSSGALDYIAEWWYIDGKYELKWITYHESDVCVQDHGSLIETVETLHDVITYCMTHLHPDMITTT